jgi:hypothetical protein
MAPDDAQHGGVPMSVCHPRVAARAAAVRLDVAAAPASGETSASVLTVDFSGEARQPLLLLAAFVATAIAIFLMFVQPSG